MSPQPAERPNAPTTSRASVVRIFAVCALLAVLFTLAGAFGSDVVPLPRRLAYWLILILSGTTLAFTLARVLSHRMQLGEHPVLLGLGIIISVSIFQTPVVWLTHLLILRQHFSVEQFIGIGIGTVCITTALTVIALMIRGDTPRVTHAAAPDAQPPAFLARIPLKLRGAELYAVEAEDHYLRLHTSKGQDLILMRLSDAVVELEGLEGAQTHRSWWVAKDALVQADRGDGRATLTLKDGSQAPVSRAYAKALREAGWF